MAISHVENIDCMLAMAKFPDKFFDLAIVDPPYGIGAQSWDFTKPNRPALTKKIKDGYSKYGAKEWDTNRPPVEYWLELFRVSKNQIVWGGNYFIEHLYASRGWVYWNKGKDCEMSTNFSHGELAWTSFDKRLLSVTISSKYGTRGGRNRIHPTEKPIRLYEWIFQNYTNPGDKILDTHLGSGSSRIAAANLGFDFWGYEIDEEYFSDQEKRFKAGTESTLFTDIQKPQPKNLFDI